MATRAAHKRLTREYQIISQNPPPYIVAHPSESNILEWHYVLTGPPETPYEGGQYWGTLVFPPQYPFAPPAIRMHTPSGRFQPSTRLCLSISDFHPKSFNPAWEVSTILIGLLSFMTSDEMTTGSVGATPHERRLFSAQTRWWNSTGGGSTNRSIPGVSSAGGAASEGQRGNVRAGDGGRKFAGEWPELDAENWRWMRERRVDPRTGRYVPDPAAEKEREREKGGGGAGGAAASSSCAPGTEALRRPSVGRIGGLNQQAREAGQGWIGSHKMMLGLLAVFGYVVIARMLGDGANGSPR